MKRLIFCCFQDEEKQNETDLKSTNIESELSYVEKINQVKEIIRKSIEESKAQRIAPRKKSEVVLSVERIPVYELKKGQLRVKNESKEIIYTN
ncbi:hypothetical protein SteCoe_31068 [Stentor coeruleus]|uniref:Uncharacterized protein n=1 Tax=Stentor coeruleus TaxID=5963 RepID=A0A1R2B237_9CILI|nr:hypothetical protein SteCoe_31068 [Stentor coeruleus]